MKQDKIELQSLYLNQFPNELKMYIIRPLIREIVQNSNDIFEAHMQLAQSGLLKNIVSIDQSFRPLLKDLRKIFLRLLNEKFPNPFFDATINGSNEVIEELFNRKNLEFDSEDEMRAAQAILAGADVNLRLAGGNPLLIGAIKYQYKKLARLLIEHGAEVNSRGIKGFTPLIIATRDFPELIKTLLEYKADPNSESDEKQTALIWAVSFGNENSVEQLLDYKANPKAKDVDGNTPVKVAKNRGDKKMIKLLKDKIAENKKCILC